MRETSDDRGHLAGGDGSEETGCQVPWYLRDVHVKQVARDMEGSGRKEVGGQTHIG